MYFPKELKAIINNKRYTKDKIGESGSVVLIYDDFVLKVSKKKKETIHELNNLHLLKDELLIPKVLYSKVTKNKIYLLMTKIEGRPLFNYSFEEAIRLSIEAYKMIIKVNVPKNNVLSYKDALEYVETNCIEDYDGLIEYAREGLYENEFKDPYDLLSFLKKNYPYEEKTCFCQGDLFLSNILSDGNEVTGIIDLGFAGYFPKERDIASLIKSISLNYNKKIDYVYEEFNKNGDLDLRKDLIDYFLLYDELI